VKYVICLCVVEFPPLAAVVRYRSPRQLDYYNSLLHSVQLLMLQRRVMRDVGLDAVGLLQKMDANDRFV